MSKAEDRARAESGTIFRDGGYVNKEDWYAAHPTRAMVQARVDKAVDEAMAQKIVKPELVIEVPIPHRYYCTACRRYHTQSSKVGKEHTNFYLEG